MTVREVPMFTVDCDGCGMNADEGGDYAGWSDRETAVLMAQEGADFQDIDGKLVCPDCREYDEEADDWKLKVVK